MESAEIIVVPVPQRPRKRYCTVCEPEEFQILKEFSNLQRGRSLKEQQRTIKKTRELAKQRWEQAQDKLKQLREKVIQQEEELFSDASTKSLEGLTSQEIAQMIEGNEQRQKLKEEIASTELETKESSYEDLRELLKEYERKGYVDVRKGRIEITSRGAQILGRGFLRKIMQNLEKKGVGTHRIEEIGYGPGLSRSSRAYELGDTYERINIEKTFLNVLERGGKINELESEDFEIFEPIHQTRLNVGIIVDESGSMDSFDTPRIVDESGSTDWFDTRYNNGQRRKIDAAIETALALSELMRTNYPQDKLRIFAFSEEAREIQPWELVGIQVPPMFYTDMRAGLRAYKTASAHEDGDKQVYLITDTEPNFDSGKYVGFNLATQSVLEEAASYRKENITLNILMLDKNNQLREFASLLARQNAGRVAFTSSENLGEAILEDYLTSKREKLLG